MTEALEGQVPAAGANAEAGTNPSQSTGPTQQEVAEQTRLAQQNRPDGIGDRDDRLVRVGRGQQTHG